VTPGLERSSPGKQGVTNAGENAAARSTVGRQDARQVGASHDCPVACASSSPHRLACPAEKLVDTHTSLHRTLDRPGRPRMVRGKRDDSCGRMGKQFDDPCRLERQVKQFAG
jgi:hypothetical protein